MPPTTVYVGSLSPAEKIMGYNALVEEGFQAPFDRPQTLQYPKIAAVKTPADLDLAPGAVPEKISFGFSPPNGRAEKLTTGRHARPLTMHSVEVYPEVYTDTLYVERKDFEKDVKGILKKVPRDLRRTDAKNPDVLLAALFRDGKTRKDYTGLKNFWDTNKPCSPEGNTAEVYDTLKTGRSLTEKNLAQTIQEMLGIKGPDGLILGVQPTTLVVPYALWHDAIMATELKLITFSGQNKAPGQDANTAAAAENPMATILKWIKEVVVLPELSDGQTINETTWYVLDCTDGPVSFCYGLASSAEYVSLMDPRDPTVFFQEKYYWGWRKVEGVNYGLPQFACRCEA